MTLAPGPGHIPSARAPLPWKVGSREAGWESKHVLREYALLASVCALALVFSYVFSVWAEYRVLAQERDAEIQKRELHVNIVRTSHAREKIRAWFKRQQRDENITQGKELLDRELKRQLDDKGRDVPDLAKAISTLAGASRRR